MKPVYTYKALSNKVFLFGFNPLDLGVIIISTLLLWGITNSLKIGFGWFCILCYLGKKLKDRPLGSEKSFMYFITTSGKLGVKNDDIPNYRSIKCQ